MNKLIIFLAFVVMTSMAWSQTPEKMSYQAVVRDASNSLVINQSVGIQISILKTTSVGTTVYTETQTPTTNTNGLISIEIGTGSIVSGDFTIIDWASDVYFIKTEIDPTGGTNYTITGTSQLMSVPYALYAKTSGSSTPGPQGETGATGTTGSQGDTGPQGIQGEAGNEGASGSDGNTWLFGTVIPTTEGLDGDFFLKTDNFEVYQKAAGTWSSTGNIKGATGDDGVAGADGNTWLFGTAIPATEGLDGDFYLKTDNFEIYQKAAGTWSSAGNITGATGAQGIQGPVGGGGATFRWTVFSSYGQANGWYGSNSSSLFGGIAPSTWTDGSAIAANISSDKQVLQTLFNKKGYAGNNAMVCAEEWYSYSSTNGKMAGALFRIENTTGSAIVWTAQWFSTAYAGWGERASVTINGADTWNSGGANYYTNHHEATAITIPANRISTIIFIAGSSPQSNTRSTFLAFDLDCLSLPVGLKFVDDLDTASNGWSN